MSDQNGLSRIIDFGQTSAILLTFFANGPTKCPIVSLDYCRETLLSMAFYKWWRESQLSQDVRMLERVVRGWDNVGVSKLGCGLGNSALGGRGKEELAEVVERPFPGKTVVPRARGRVPCMWELHARNLHTTCRRLQYSIADRQCCRESSLHGGITGTAEPLPLHSSREPVTMMPSQPVVECGGHGGR